MAKVLPFHPDPPMCVYCNEIITYLQYRIDRCEESPSKMHETEELSDAQINSLTK